MITQDESIKKLESIYLNWYDHDLRRNWEVAKEMANALNCNISHEFAIGAKEMSSPVIYFDPIGNNINTIERQSISGIVYRYCGHEEFESLMREIKAYDNPPKTGITHSNVIQEESTVLRLHRKKLNLQDA